MSLNALIPYSYPTGLAYQKIVMQGTVWGGLKCTTTMDGLPKQILQDAQSMYKYRGVVSIPPLEMVDDVITAVECGSKSVKLNAAVNAFIDSKKLSLSTSKCSKIHIGNKKTQEQCPDLKIKNVSIKCSEKEKYLGDYITKRGNSKETIKERNLRGDSILSNMRAILQDIPLGNRRTQTGLIFRQAWFINGCFLTVKYGQE